MPADAVLLGPAGASRPLRVWLYLAAALSVLAACSPRDLWAPDEPRYGLVARHMETSGDWLVPRVNGKPYPEKPPVAFWAMAAVGTVSGGVGAVAARLGCALLAAAAVLTLARLARRWFADPAIGDTAGILFATSGLVLWNSSRAALDLPMTLFALLAWEAGTLVVLRRTALAALAFGAALGLGILVKGPHALYVPVLGVVGGCLASGQARRLRDPRWLLSLAALAAVVAAWLVPAIAAAGGELTADGSTYRGRLLGQLATRVSGESEPHAHPLWFFVPLLLGVGLPWTPAWVAGIRHATRVREGASTSERFGLGGATVALLVSLLALSIPGSKREIYLIPPLAAACVLAAVAVRRVPADVGVKATPIVAAVVCGGAALLFAAAPFAAASGLVPQGPASDVVDDLARLPVGAALVGLALLAACAAWATLRARRDPALAVVVAATGLGVVWVVLALTVLPALGERKSYADAALVADRERPGAPLLQAGFTDPSVLWWFRRDTMTVLGNAAYAETARALAPDAPEVVVLVKGKFWRARDVLAAPGDRAILDRATVLWRGEVGGGEQLLVANVPRP